MSGSRENGWTLEHLALVAADLGAWDWDIPTDRVTWSERVYSQYRTDRFDGTVAAFVALIHPDDREMVGQALGRAIETGPDEWSIEHRVAAAPDTWLFCRGRVFRDDQGRAVRMAGIVQDVTERRVIEEAMRQSQKLEAIGRLAGGVAHDFNNLLTAIVSFATLGRKHAGQPELLVQDLDDIVGAADRATTLTKQLLAFARRDVVRPIVFDARDRVQESMRMLSAIVGEHVVIEQTFSAEPCWVQMDAGHLQQVLVNLTANARDAMPNGGRLTLSVERHDAAGCVQIRVRDTGCGMTDETRRRALEPFFTTKPMYHGTGLGLSTCHGIVTQAGGIIGIESEVGVGTAILVRLPLAQPRTSVAPAAEQCASAD